MFAPKNTSIYLPVYLRQYMQLQVHMYIKVFVYTYIYVYVHIDMCICVYTYVYHCWLFFICSFYTPLLLCI